MNERAHHRIPGEAQLYQMLPKGYTLLGLIVISAFSIGIYWTQSQRVEDEVAEMRKELSVLEKSHSQLAYDHALLRREFDISRSGNNRWLNRMPKQ